MRAFYLLKVRPTHPPTHPPTKTCLIHPPTHPPTHPQTEALASLPSWAGKDKPPVEIEEVWGYYEGLIERYLPGGVRW